MDPIAATRTHIRSLIDQIAIVLNRVSNGRVTPDMVTWVGFLMHFAIGYYIVIGQLVTGAILLIIFGLFDALDGSLARLQNKASSRGMFLDAVTDRFKEVIVYASIAWYLPAGSNGQILCVVACGMALSISYVKAKGESAIATLKTNAQHQEINRMFHDGIAAFEVRIFVICVGLLTGQIVVAIALLVAVGFVTLVQRFIHVYRAL